MTPYQFTLVLAQVWACAAVLQLAHGILIDPLLLLVVAAS